MAKQYKENKKFFNDLSGNYNEYLSRMDPDNLIGNAMLKYMDLKANSVMLDIGIGTAYYSVMVAKNIKNLKVIGVDVSDGMLEQARKKIASEGMSKFFELKNINIEIYTFNQKFDGVLTSSAMRYFENQKEIVKKVYDHLKPGGKFVINEIRKPEDENVFSFKVVSAFYPGLVKRSTMQQYMEEAGFTDIVNTDIDMIPRSQIDINSMREQMEKGLSEETKKQVQRIFQEAAASGELERSRATGMVFTAYVMSGTKR